MLAQQVRGTQVETFHDGAVACLTADGTVVFAQGEIDRPFFYRSSAKPFQGFVTMEVGADLAPTELAMACASHRGFPAQLAIVESMLAHAGLDETALKCPLDWPLSSVAKDLVVASGEKSPRRIWHNCSGKHAGFLRACVANGWPVESYLDPSHPLQQRVISFVGDVGDFDPEPVGVDGCGAPVLRTTVRTMALMFAKLATEDRFEPIRTAMHRYPALIGSNSEGDSRIAIASNSVAKGGAVGCAGAGVEGQVGIAAKAWDGMNLIAYQAIAVVLDRLGLLSDVGRSELDDVLAPPVFGGGEVVGSFESLLGDLSSRGDA